MCLAGCAQYGVSEVPADPGRCGNDFVRDMNVPFPVGPPSSWVEGRFTEWREDGDGNRFVATFESTSGESWDFGDIFGSPHVGHQVWLTIPDMTYAGDVSVRFETACLDVEFGLSGHVTIHSLTEPDHLLLSFGNCYGDGYGPSGEPIPLDFGDVVLDRSLTGCEYTLYTMEGYEIRSVPLLVESGGESVTLYQSETATVGRFRIDLWLHQEGVDAEGQSEGRGLSMVLYDRSLPLPPGP